MKTGHSAQNPVAPPLVESPMLSPSSQCLRHWRPSPWANRESSRITVAECFGFQIWIIANWRYLTASVCRPRAAFTNTPSTNSSPGTAPNPDSPLIVSSSCATACTWNHAMLALLFGCGFRRSELVGLELDEIQMRQGHWAVVDLIGKGGHIRTVPIPRWVKAALDQWIVAAKVTEGRIFRAVARAGKVWGKGISQNVVWYVVKGCCERAGLEHIAPHDLRRTCAKLCHSSGGELEQIQFLLGHASVQTTERYLGCKQNLGHPVNDLFELRTEGRPQENDDGSATIKAPDPVEKTSGQGIECRHGGSEHDQPVCDARQLSPPERSDMVEVRKSHRPQSLRRCPGTRASRSDSEDERVTALIRECGVLPINVLSGGFFDIGKIPFLWARNLAIEFNRFYSAAHLSARLSSGVAILGHKPEEERQHAR